MIVLETIMVLNKVFSIRLLLLTSILFSLASCNEAEFYKKEFLKGAGVDLDGPNPTKKDIPESSNEHNNDQDQSDDKVGQSNDSDSDDDNDNGPSYKSISETFIQKEQLESKVDILWVIDDSGSMGNEQESLSYNFDAFIGDFIAKDVDFRMAITTTDPTHEVDGKMVCDWRLLDSIHANNNQQDFLNKFKECIKVGTRGSGREKGLNATERFLYHYNKENQQNKFLRDDAYLVVVVVSDEEDQSRKSVSHYVNKLRSVKPNEGMVKIYSIVNTEQKKKKWETKGSRYIEASKLTSGVVANIKNNFYQILTDFGSVIVDLLDSFSIANSPIGNSVEVFVDGEESEEFIFSEDSNSIKFNQGHVPAAGSTIQIKYQVASTGGPSE